MPHETQASFVHALPQFNEEWFFNLFKLWRHLSSFGYLDIILDVSWPQIEIGREDWPVRVVKGEH